MSLLGEREREAIAELLGALDRDVPVRLDIGPAETPVALLAAGGREVDPCGETRALAEALASISDRVRLDVVEHEEPGLYPSLTIGPGLVYLGMPWGYELGTLVHGIAAAGRRDAGLSQQSIERLASIEQDVRIDVFVTPT